MSVDGPGFHVEVDVLDNAAKGITQSVHHQQTFELRGLCGDAELYGHGGVHATLAEYCARWSGGLDTSSCATRTGFASTRKEARSRARASATTHRLPGTSEEMKDYTQFADLANMYLEDSFVLGIDEKPDALSFKLEVALTPSHPRYHAPRPDEQYCYANAILTIGGATRIEWVTRSSQTYRDATGEEDLGNIDSLKYIEDYYEIAGDWGRVRIYSTTAPQMTFTSAAIDPDG